MRKEREILDTATQCFHENMQEFGGETEKKRLYLGLMNLTDGLKSINQELRYIRSELEQLNR